MLGAVLTAALSTYLLQVPAEAAGPVETITVTLSPSSIVADGVSTATATARLLVAGAPMPGQKVAFSSTDNGIRFGPTVDDHHGNYTTVLTGSTTVGTATITTTSSWGGQKVAGQATLTQIPGPARYMTLALEPRSIVADGSSSATALVTIADAHGHPVAADTVVFSSSDPGEAVLAAANTGNGTYRALIRSSTTPGEVAITATDTESNMSVSSELRQTVGGNLLSFVTMQWTFHYALAYTKIFSLVINGAPPGASVLVGCHGRGCPFNRRLTLIGETRRCGPKGKRGCASGGAIDLAPEFRQRRLGVGTRITVAVTRPDWIGKFYTFTTRAGFPPRVHVTCLPPGETSPGTAC
jgi:Invasin, domain 3